LTLRITNNILKSNRLILTEILGTDGKLKLTKTLLLKKGIGFDYLTWIY